MGADFIESRGLRIPKDPILNASGVRAALRKGAYERREVDAVDRVVRRHDRVLELGGGIGFMSAFLCARKQVEHVTTFEANPALIPYIRRVHAANGVENATLHNALVTPQGGPPLPFHLRDNFLASSLDAAAEPVAETVLVPQHPLAEALAEARPTVLVCDIEGAEATLLPAGDWSCLRLAVIELHPQWIGQAGVQAVFDAMHRVGLTYFPKASEGKVVTFRRGW